MIDLDPPYNERGKSSRWCPGNDGTGVRACVSVCQPWCRQPLLVLALVLWKRMFRFVKASHSRRFFCRLALVEDKDIRIIQQQYTIIPTIRTDVLHEHPAKLRMREHPGVW